MLYNTSIVKFIVQRTVGKLIIITYYYMDFLVGVGGGGWYNITLL